MMIGGADSQLACFNPDLGSNCISPRWVLAHPHGPLSLVLELVHKCMHTFFIAAVRSIVTVMFWYAAFT
eukprot:5529713-Ditylum_brightwellii.AAC.1